MITKDEIIKIAELARLELTEGEVEKYHKDLNAILAGMKKLESIDTSNIERTTHAVTHFSVLRSDEIGESLPHEEVFKNAPEESNGYFRVPRIMEE